MSPSPHCAPHVTVPAMRRGKLCGDYTRREQSNRVPIRPAVTPRNVWTAAPLSHMPRWQDPVWTGAGPFPQTPSALLNA
jgi:hypothetical protein